MVIRELFNIYGGNSGLTESIIYQNPPQSRERSVTVYSGATLDSTRLGDTDKDAVINGRKIKIFSAPALIIVRKGLAGKTKLIGEGTFTINDDAYVITVKKKYIDEIDIEWAWKVIENYAIHCISSKGTNATFSKEQFLDMEFLYPPLKEQKEIIRVCRNIDMLKQKMHMFDGQLKKLDACIISSDAVCTKQAERIFDIKGGNPGLTEEFIYNNQPSDKKEAITVFSSSTDTATNMGTVSRNARIGGETIKIFQGPALIISRNGQAGKVTFIEKEVFTTNDHAYVLTVKPAYEREIDLEWFAYVSEKYTKNCVTSKDSNGTFNKEIFLREQIDIANYDMQREIVNIKKNMHELHFRLKKFVSILDEK